VIPAKPTWMLVCFLCLTVIPTLATIEPADWNGPANDLSERIAAILGPSQAQLTLRNLSRIPAAEVTPIRRLIEADLKTHGVIVSGSDSANSVRVTLSETATGRMWIAEITEGNQTQVAMVSAGPLTIEAPRDPGGILLQATALAFAPNAAAEAGGIAVPARNEAPLLAALQTDSGLLLLQAEAVEFYIKTAAGYRLQQSIPIAHGRPIPRDARGRLLADADKTSFAAYLPGIQCEGHFAASAGGDGSETATLHCKDSDDPWPLGGSGSAGRKAFYNSARNWFSGVVTPGVSLPPFYEAAELPRASGAALLVEAVDGSVELLEGNARKPVSGARDWGSDFAVLTTVCGNGAPTVLVSGSGEAASDSLRAYTIPAQEAVPASAPLAIQGTVTAIAATQDGAALAIVRASDGVNLAGQSRAGPGKDRSLSTHDEVLRVAAICN
jgi:hypothetical protein